MNAPQKTGNPTPENAGSNSTQTGGQTPPPNPEPVPRPPQADSAHREEAVPVAETPGTSEPPEVPDRGEGWDPGSAAAQAANPLPGTEPQEPDKQPQPNPATSKPLSGEPLALSRVLGTVEALTPLEQANLYACEEVVRAGWYTFVQVGLALAQIRDQRLYRLEFDSFEAYCQVKWQYGRRYVNQLISAAQVFTYLGAKNSLTKPEHETQVRPLVGLTADQASEGSAPGESDISARISDSPGLTCALMAG
jgi:hypothetical protein